MVVDKQEARERHTRYTSAQADDGGGILDACVWEYVRDGKVDEALLCEKILGNGVKSISPRVDSEGVGRQREDSEK